MKTKQEHLNRWLTAATIFVAFILATLPSSAQDLNFLAPAGDGYQDEQDFLARASGDWKKVAEGVYEIEGPDGAVRHRGFGPASIDFFISQQQRELQRLMTLPKRSEGGSASREVAAVENRIASLRRSQARWEEKANQPRRSTPCYGVNVQIRAFATCDQPGSGFGFGAVSFTDFGPCNQAEALVGGSGIPGFTATKDGALQCYESRVEGARCTPDNFGSCFITGFAEIDFTTCDNYQVETLTAQCTGGSSGGGLPL